MNYELRVTWLTPEVVRASARLRQLRDRASADQARKWVEDAEGVADTVLMIELDPREGSGVIPLDWAAYLQPKGTDPDSGRSAKGTPIERARDYPGLTGVEKRDYDFDVFWLGFDLTHADGTYLLEGAQLAEVVVRVMSSEGRVQFPVPGSVRLKR